MSENGDGCYTFTLEEVYRHNFCVTIICTIQTCTVVIRREKKKNLCENDGSSITIVHMIKFYNRERDYFNLRNNYSSRIITFCNEDAIE